MKYITAGEDIGSSTENDDEETVPQPKPLEKKPAKTVISDEVEQTPTPEVKTTPAKKTVTEDDFTDENGEIDVDKLLDNI